MSIFEEYEYRASTVYSGYAIHDKTYFWHVRPANLATNTQISMRTRSLTWVFVVHMKNFASLAIQTAPS